MPTSAVSPASRSVRIIALVAVIVALAGVALWLFGPLLGAALGLIDDHEIVAALGPDHSLSLGEIPGLLAKTELGHWASGTRFRPVYYLLRLIETAAWGDHATAWFSVRIVLAVVTAGLIATVAFRAFALAGASVGRVVASAIVAFAAGVLVLAAPAWADIVMRLGPSEIYLAAALALIAMGCQILWRAPERTAGWVLLLIGSVIAVGSKENGIVVLVVLVGILALRVRDSRFPRLWTVLSAVVAAFGIWVVLGVAIGVRAAGGDVYNNDRSLSSSLHFLSQTIFQSRYFAIVLIVLALCLFVDRAVRPTPRAEGTGWRGRLGRVAAVLESHPHVLAAAMLLIVVVTEALFYRAEFIPARYAIVSELAVLLSLVVLASALLRLRDAGRVPLVVAAALLLAVTLASGAVYDLKVASGGFRVASAGIANLTRDVQSDIAAVGELIDRTPGAQVLIIATEPNRDYERVASLGQYLSAYGITDQSFLHNDFGAGQSALAASLEDTARAGYAPWHILPHDEFDPSADTVCVYLEEAATLPPECEASQLIDG